jgi:hypothetical protein
MSRSEYVCIVSVCVVLCDSNLFDFLIKKGSRLL